MIHQNDPESPQPVAEAESLVGVASTDLFGVDGATGRGFPYVEFRDEYGEKCSIQISSRAVFENEDGTVDDPLGWIWLGIDDAKPQIMKSKAKALGMELPPGEVSGWMPYPIPDDVLLTTRMHLNETQVRGLIARLTLWLETGNLSPNIKVMDAAPFQLEITTDAPAAFHAPSCSGSLDLRLGDCMEVMAGFPDGYFDLAIVDPPYGIGEDGGKCRTRGSKRTNGEAKGWDKEPPPMEYFVELRRVAKHQIIWGGNYFADKLPASRCWIYWQKDMGGDFADGELAWTSFDRVLKQFRKRSETHGRIHPTQKPVDLYKWTLANFAKPGMRVLDTHLGSGSHAIAAHYAGVHLTACEIDPDYFHAAKARIARETSQLDFFSPQNVPTHPPDGRK
jgi:site-specific DNA-methyltransferase (adenine-specific)